MSINEPLVLHLLYSQADTSTTGAAIRVERAMSALAALTLCPSATSALGSHSSTPKLTKLQANAASVRALVMPSRPGRLPGSGG